MIEILLHWGFLVFFLLHTLMMLNVILNVGPCELSSFLKSTAKIKLAIIVMIIMMVIIIIIKRR